MAPHLPSALLDQINASSQRDRARLAASATRAAEHQAPIGLRYGPEERIRDLASGLAGQIEHAGRDERTGWELYRVRLEDGRIVFRSDREIARDRIAASGAERPR